MKKTLGMIIAAILFFTATTVVSARMMTMKEISDDFNENFIEVLQGDGSSLNTVIDEENTTFTVKYGNEELMKFNYTDEYMEYDVRGTQITEEKSEESFVQMFIIRYLLDSIFRVSGHDGYELSDEEADYSSTYDTYGLEVESEEFHYSGGDDVSSWEMGGDYITHFKVSFDTEKIDALIQRYGQEIEDDIYLTLDVAGVTTSSAKLIPHIIVDDDSLGMEYLCDVYRADKEEGNYTLLTNEPILCNTITGYEDKSLTSGKTYYYKVGYHGSNYYSEPVKVTTLNNTAVAQKEKPEQNPPTGVGFYTITTLLLIIGSILLSRIVKRKSVFQKL